MADYLEHCIDAYGGEKSSEVYHLKGAFKILRRTHGELLAKDFGPKAFTELRLEFINAGWSRTYIGDQCGRIKRMFAWGVAQEVLHGDARHRLDAVRPLKPGEHGVRETPPVKPVSQADLDATLKLMKPERADQVRLLLLTGMRPQELMQLSVEHIDRTTDVFGPTPPAATQNAALRERPCCGHRPQGSGDPNPVSIPQAVLHGHARRPTQRGTASG